MNTELPCLLYQDEHYLGVYKPAGLSSHPTRDPLRPSLVTWIANIYPELANATLAHRLDVETSGVILFAKTRQARQALDQLFKQHHIQKTYYGLVYGNPSPPRSGEWHDFVKEVEHNKLSNMEIVTSGGDRSVTEYELITQSVGLCLMRFRPKTGRKHQIRVQAAFHGLPLVGDELYGPFRKDQGIPTWRHWLHAAELEFLDPLSQSTIKIESPLPPDFYELLKLGFHNKYLVLNKPYDVVSQFSAEAGEKTLADLDLPKDVWPVGRLDKRSEGFLILTDDRAWRHFIMSPESNKCKIYWAQVEGVPQQKALEEIEAGPILQGKKSKSCDVQLLSDEQVAQSLARNWPEGAPIRERKNIPTSWLEIVLREGKNHQVRRMTAAVGYPTLRLIRVGYGEFRPGDLPGQWRSLTPQEITLMLHGPKKS